MACALALALSLTVPAAAQPTPAAGTPAQLDIVDLIKGELKKIASDRLETMPRLAPAAKQTTAPASASGAKAVDDPSFTELLSLAFDNQFLKREDDVFTIDLNLFAFRAAVDPGVLDQQERYGTRVNDLIRRLGGSVSFGGKGEAFDADGDGKAEAAETAKTATDIVNWEFRYRFRGSRDRRDDENLRLYVSQIIELNDQVEGGIANLIASHADEIRAIVPTGQPITAQAFEQIKKAPGFHAGLEALAVQFAALTKADQKALAKIDKRSIWTLVGGGTQRKVQFGPDKWNIGLRGVWNRGRLDHTFNADFNRTESFLGHAPAQIFKAGYQASALVLKGRTFGEDGAKLSLAASFERYRNVPAAKHDTVLKASTGVDFPLAEGISLPISIAYANHRDLLGDKGQIIGNVALAIDFSGLNKKKAEKADAK
jgi:hypothetical protein